MAQTKTINERTNRAPRVTLGVTGGIAAYKAAEILRGLQKAGCEVRVCMTRRACEFITPLTFRALSSTHVVVDDYAPDNPDPIAHITFSQSVDLFIVAPATADIIAKFANGIADDFLSSTYLASHAPVLIAPAMNTTMWEHPATRRNLATLCADGVRFVEPDAGEMACGTVGAGRLAEPDVIVAAALQILNENSSARQNKNLSLTSNPIVTRALDEPDLRGEKILITAGGTQEAIDAVRFITNRSSGRMGFALAEAAQRRGAEVTVIAGSISLAPPSEIKVIRALSAAEMFATVQKEISDATIFISAAAVADFRPVTSANGKIKKTDAALTLQLEPTIDILATIGANKRDGLLLVGFAAETSELINHARAKLEKKNLDLIVANDVTQAGAGFDVATNIVTLISRRMDAPMELPLMSKADAAGRILDEIINLRAESRNRFQ